IEFAVKMKRLPEKYFLKNLIKRGNVSLDDLRRIMEKLVEFYKSQSNSGRISDYGRPERIKIFIYNNISLVRNFIGKTISSNAHAAITFYNDMFFEKTPLLFQERIKKGFIKDCHGDLHLYNINISPKYVCIHDRIEFNDRFRYIDIASDIAFLAMDLDFNGRSDFADYVVSEISKRMHDDTIFKIIDFYKCYRAYVRGKVESLKSEGAGIPKREVRSSQKRAKDYFRLSLKYALFGSQPKLIVVFGLIGTGKSTLAKLLSRELTCEVVSSDRIRKEMLGIAPTERKYEEFERGIYSKNINERVYKEITRQGIQAVQSGKIVILDASFSKRKYRKLIINKAKSLDVPIFFIQAKASEKTIRGRLIKRQEVGKAISDGRWEIFDKFKEGFEQPVELARDKYLLVNTDKTMEETLTQTLIGIVKKRI
ncbi:MAG: AAA family ATPase, partial [Thermodesulfobacteriota bacterium]